VQYLSSKMIKRRTFFLSRFRPN